MNIQEEKNKIDIVGIIEKSVHIQKKGKDFFGLCPFHAEKTASFSVSPVKQIYHCFGCGAGGDVIEFVMKYNSLDFMAALQFLGIEPETQKTRVQTRRASRKRYQIQHRKAEQDKLLYEYETWVSEYFHDAWWWLKVSGEYMQKLTWDEICQLDGLIKQRSVWRYHVYLIEHFLATIAEEDVIYELYKDMNN